MVESASTAVLADSTIRLTTRVPVRDDAFCEEDGIREGDGF